MTTLTGTPPRVRWTVGLTGLAVLAACAGLSVAVGARMLPPADVLQGLAPLLGGEATGSPTEAVVRARADRTLIGVLVGVAVALSGAAMQGLTRNPLADPGLLGVNAGAALAIVLGIQAGILGGASGYVWFAMLGGVVAAAVVYGVASLGPAGPQPLTMTLTGAALTAGVTSVVAGVLVTNDGALEVFRFWQVGSIAGRSAELVTGVAPVLLAGLLIVALSGPVLNATALGEDLERALGQRALLARGVVALGAVALAASAVAMAGPIAFVGLVVPHLVRLVTGPDYRRVLLGSALVGPVLVLATDVLGRVVSPPSEVQVGIMTAVLGAPALIVLVRRTAVR